MNKRKPTAGALALALLVSLATACGGPKCTNPYAESTFMDRCQANGGGYAPCGCVWYSLAERYDCDEFEDVTFRELNEISSLCEGAR